MSDPDYLRPDIAPVLDELRTFPIIFLHAGTLFRPDAITDGLTAGLIERGITPSVVEADAPDRGDSKGNAIVLRGLDRIAAASDRCERLGQLRSWVMLRAESGSRVIVQSIAPKLQLVGCPGSQLVLDARTSFLSGLGEEQVDRFLAEHGLDQRDAQLSKDLAGGRPGLLEELQRAFKAGDNDKQAVMDALEARLARALKEAGWEVASFLDRLEFEAADVHIEQALTDPLLYEALRGTGLISRGEHGEVRLLTPRLSPSLRRAVRTNVDTLFEPPSAVKDTVLGLWEIERRLRRLIQLAAISRHRSNWRQHVVSGDLARRVRDRATAETLEVVDDHSVLGNPLEWLTLDELLSLVLDPAGLETPGLPGTFWRQLGNDLVPIRNRVAHTRLPGPGDADAVRKWRTELRRRQG